MLEGESADSNDCGGKAVMGERSDLLTMVYVTSVLLVRMVLADLVVLDRFTEVLIRAGLEEDGLYNCLLIRGE